MTTADQPAKFYVVVRADLSPGQQLAQSVHATAQFCMEWSEVAKPWYFDSNYFVGVTVQDEDALKEIADLANELGIRYSIVEEPDLHDEWTAVALEPGETARLICTMMPLALKHAEEPKVEEDYYIHN